MSIQTSLLCPIDFSPLSLGALHYALAIARRFHAGLTVLSVVDPLLVEVGDTRMGTGWAAADSERRLREMVATAEAGYVPIDVSYQVRSGKPSTRIRDVARAQDSALIVMSTHGRGGIRKLLLGTTAERVLRDATVPVLLAPEDPGPLSFEELAKRASPMLVPVDFSCATGHQLTVAGWIAAELRAHILIGHVIEPIDLPVPEQIDAAEVLSERHRRACRGLQAIAMGRPLCTTPEILVSSGKAAEEIARWARDHRAGLLVMAMQ